MAEIPTSTGPEPGAPIPRDAIDPELVKLARSRPRIGAITAVGVIALCVYFIVRLNPDRRFGGEPETPRPVALADVAAGRIPADSYVTVEATPVYGHAVRTSTSARDSGYRVAPARGTGDRVWLVVSGNGDQRPTEGAHAGRVRMLDELRLAHVLRSHLTAYPRPAFATVASVRAGFAAGRVTTIDGDAVPVADGDAVAFDVVDPARTTVIASFVGARGASEGDPGHGPLESGPAWIAELAKHGLTAVPAPAVDSDATLGQVRLEIALPVAEVAAKLETARLAATRVEPTARHLRTTWGALRASPAGALATEAGPVPEAGIDLVGLYVLRGAPEHAYAVVVGERPEQYWYILPITIALAALALLFAWALVRAIRDLLPAQAAPRAE